MTTKLLDEARMKATTDQATKTRTLDFYAAAFSAFPDKAGDVIDPHAFDLWLKEFYAAGKPLQISYRHSAMLDELDPTNIIGYAPADPEHVWVDDYGLRVKALLFTGSSLKADHVATLIDSGVVRSASLAMRIPKGSDKRQRDGSTRIMQAEVLEAGPCPNPVEEAAVVLSLKAVDESTWDGNKAMTACSSPADYAAICAGEHTQGNPDERQHWALPHHYLGQGPNADGVRAALSRVAQTQNITDAERQKAQAHLESHMAAIQIAEGKSKSSEIADDIGELVMKHQSASAKIQQAFDLLIAGGAKCPACVAREAETAAKAAQSEDTELKADPATTNPGDLANTHKSLHEGDAGHAHSGTKAAGGMVDDALNRLRLIGASVP